MEHFAKLEKQLRKSNWCANVFDAIDVIFRNGNQPLRKQRNEKSRYEI